MMIAEVISSLLDQIDDRVSLIPADDPDSIFAHDAEALREAVRILRRLERTEKRDDAKMQEQPVNLCSMDMTFIGKDGSMGLQYGKQYTVTVFHASDYYWMSWNTGHGNVLICPYSSLKTLLDNWQTQPVSAPMPKNPYRVIAKHLFRAHRMYTRGKTILILADDIIEATAKARAVLGVSSVVVSRLISTGDAQVYEV